MYAFTVFFFIKVIGLQHVLDVFFFNLQIDVFKIYVIYLPWRNGRRSWLALDRWR